MIGNTVNWGTNRWYPADMPFTCRRDGLIALPWDIFRKEGSSVRSRVKQKRGGDENIGCVIPGEDASPDLSPGFHAR